MRKLGVVFATLAFSGGSTFAADMAVKMPVKAPPIVADYDWTGFYLGAYAGVGIQKPRSRSDGPA